MDGGERDHTPAEVAELLGCSKWWVEEQVRQKRVTHQRYGRGVIRFTPAQIEELRELATVQPADPAKSTIPAAAVAALGATRRSQAAQRSRRLRAASGGP